MDEAHFRDRVWLANLTRFRLLALRDTRGKPSYFLTITYTAISFPNTVMSESTPAVGLFHAAHNFTVTSDVLAWLGLKARARAWLMRARACQICKPGHRGGLGSAQGF